MDRRVFTAILLSVVVVALVYLAFRLFEPFLFSILWAAVIAVVTHPGHAFLARRLGGRNTLAAGLMTFLVFLVVVGPFAVIALVLAGEIITFAAERDMDARLREFMEYPSVAWMREHAESFLQKAITVERVASLVRESIVPILAQAKDAVLFVFSLLGGILMMLLSLFFFYRDGPALVRASRELLPMEEADRDEIFHDVNGAIQASVRGGLVVALLQGLLGFVILLILGVSKPALGAAAMTVASFIPLVGTAAVWLPIALYLGIHDGETAKAIVLAAYGVVVIGGSDNLLRPILLGRHMEAHPLMLFFGVLGGLVLFGFAGIVLGPIAVASLNVTARLLRRRFAKPPPTESAAG